MNLLSSKDQAYTSFGQLPLSVEKTAPAFGFGTAGKNDYLKQHLNADLTKQCGGNQCSPGPYIQLKNVTDPRFHKGQTWKIGTDERVTLGIRLDRQKEGEPDLHDNPLDSHLQTMPRFCSPKFGTASRTQATISELERTPGPQYYPPLKPEVPTAASYTLGAKRESGSGLINKVATPGNIGPGSYIPEQSAKTSVHKNAPASTFPKAPKKPMTLTYNAIGQTYHTHAGIGRQLESKKKSETTVKIGTAKRGNPKVGIMVEKQMTTKVRIEMPKF